MAKSKSFKGERQSWQTVDLMVESLRIVLSARDLFFGGSYCRHQDTCGDIDIAILRHTEPDGYLTNDSINQLLDLYSGEVLISGPSQKRFVLSFPLRPELIRFQVDFWLIDNPGQWGPLCMFVAGSGRFNIMQRAQASRQGYSLSQYGLFQKGVSVGDFPTEQSVYQHLGWPWIPHDRRS